MKKTHVIIIALVFIITGCGLLTRGRELPIDRMTFKPLAFTPPVPERIVLDNGMILYLLEDHELPLIEISGLIRAGAVNEPAGLAGLAALTATVMRTGGTQRMSADEVDRTLEDMSAEIGVSIGSEQGSASLSVLKEDFQAVLPVFADILMHPAFEQEKFLVARNMTIQGLRRLPDNPQALAFREYKKLLYAGDPRGSLPTMGTVSSIRRDDLVAFHRRVIRPENTLLAITGDFNRDEMLAKIREQFGGWKRSAVPVEPVPSPKQRTGVDVYHLQKQLTQSTLVLGHFAPAKQDRDYFAFLMLDFIIGSGGFTSRLFSEIRTRQGLAYSVGSFYRPDTGYGTFGAYCMTKASTTRRALDLMLEAIESVRAGRITPEEFQWARESIINNFIFAFSSNKQIATQQMGLEFDGLPSDFYLTAPDRIRALTLDDLRRVAHERLRPEKLLVLVLGDKDQLDAPLDAWKPGPVHTITSDVLNEK